MDVLEEVKGMDMDASSYNFRQLGEEDFPAIQELFVSVFTKEPWNDNWSDAAQLHAYIQDLTGQGNSLTFGLYEGAALIGLSMGRTKHWYTGTEYCIDEFCIRTGGHGKGAGTFFMGKIEEACKELGMTHIFLLTDKDIPAYGFYRKLGFTELESNVAFAKEL